MTSTIFATAATITAVCALIYVLNFVWEKGRTARRRRIRRRNYDILSPLCYALMKSLANILRDNDTSGKGEEK